jgi:hypothetical protein
VGHPSIGAGMEPKGVLWWRTYTTLARTQISEGFQWATKVEPDTKFQIGDYQTSVCSANLNLLIPAGGKLWTLRLRGHQVVAGIKHIETHTRQRPRLLAAFVIRRNAEFTRLPFLRLRLPAASVPVRARLPRRPLLLLAALGQRPLRALARAGCCGSTPFPFLPG